MTEIKRNNELIANPIMDLDLNNVKTEDLVRMMVVTVNNTAKTVETMAKSAQQQAITIAKHDRNIAFLLKENEDRKLNERIEAWQDQIIKKKVAKMIKRQLGEDYKNRSKMRIAYGWTYRNLANFGYGSGCSTKLRQYEPILETLDSGALDISKVEVNARYKQIQKEKEENR